MQSDLFLVNLVLCGEANAFDLLVKRHYGMARSIARQYASSSDDIDDLVQESFVAAYERLEQLSEPDKFAGWLAAIVRNRGLMWQRQRANHPTLFSMDDDGHIAAGLLNSVHADEARRCRQRNAVRDAVNDALTSLNRDHRRLVQLHYFEGYDYHETAALLDIPINAVRGRLDRARTALRKELRKIKMGDTTSGWELNAEELDAIRTAEWFAANDPDRPVMNAIYFDGKGNMMSTDAHRLYIYTAESFSNREPLLIHRDMARLLRDEHPEARSGKMLVDAREAVLDLDNGRKIRAAVVDDKFPNWQACVPGAFKYKFSVQVEHILNAVDAIARQRDSGLVQKLSKEDEFRTLITLVPVDGRMIISKGHEGSANKGVSWETRIMFSAKFSAGDEELTFAMNWLYLEQAISALRLPGDASVEFCMNTELSPILTQAAGGGKGKVVTMPMQRVSNAVEQSTQAVAS